jgi:hypothetical protein
VALAQKADCLEEQLQQWQAKLRLGAHSVLTLLGERKNWAYIGDRNAHTHRAAVYIEQR